MKKSVYAVLMAGLTLASCATILSKSDWPVSIQSQAAGVPFTITNREGTVVATGTTPQTVILKSGAGYFKSEKYNIQFGTGPTAIAREVKTDINGWYFANILFGGVIGMLIVDPLTGAMYRLPETVSASSFEPQETNAGERQLKVVSLYQLTPTEREQLIAIQ